jgi:beta-glucanase (GH16 family)
MINWVPDTPAGIIPHALYYMSVRTHTKPLSSPIVLNASSPPGDWLVNKHSRPIFVQRLLRAACAVFVICAFDLIEIAAASGEPRHIDLSRYHLTFYENFRQPLQVTPWGPSKWIAHTPWNGDFGDARFVDPTGTFPFVTGPDGLQIIARKQNNGKWESGLLSSRDPHDAGFKQAGGYFEARMKFPPGPGTWPAFWLVARGDPNYDAEIDVVEYYGKFTDGYHVNLHFWPKANTATPRAYGAVVPVPAHSLTDDYHIYGVEVLESEIVFYLDRVEVKALATFEPTRYPMSILIDLALGSGWPINQTINPSILRVDYVGVYQKN